MPGLSHYPVLLTIALSTLAASRASAEGCQHCGRSVACQKICRLVCEEKNVEVVVWGCKSEDFCVPGPSRPGCRHAEEVTAACDSPVCALPKKFVWAEWLPGKAKVFTRKKLMKKTETVKTPGFKWVVEELCVECEANCPCAQATPGVELPPPPFPDAKLKYGWSITR